MLKPVPGAQLFQIVPGASLLRVLVFRAGPLASAGHNHVIASHDIKGTIYLHPDIEKSAFDLSLPLESLDVDEPRLRREEGADFSAEVPESARQGTRKNMLGEALLEVGRYPAIRVISQAVKGASEDLTVTVRIGVKDKWSPVSVPIVLRSEGDRLSATGEFELRQTELGLKPFSIMMGALQVQDLMRIKFKVTAERRDQ